MDLQTTLRPHNIERLDKQTRNTKPSQPPTEMNQNQIFPPAHYLSQFSDQLTCFIKLHSVVTDSEVLPVINYEDNDGSQNRS